DTPFAPAIPGAAATPIPSPVRPRSTRPRHRSLHSRRAARLALKTNPGGVEDRVGLSHRLRGRRPMFGFPFRDPGQAVLDRQSANRRLVQPGRQAHATALGGLPSSQKHRLFEGNGQLLNGHTKRVAPRSYFFLPPFPPPPLRVPLPCFLGLAFFLALGQPVTPIFVVWLMTAPFWAVRVVGIVSFCEHMLFFAFTGMSVARTEWGPCGNTVTNELIGASGTLLNVLVVMPFLMFVLPSR